MSNFEERLDKIEKWIANKEYEEMKVKEEEKEAEIQSLRDEISRLKRDNAFLRIANNHKGLYNNV